MCRRAGGMLVLVWLAAGALCAGAAEPAPHPHEPINLGASYTVEVLCKGGKVAIVMVRGPGLPLAGRDTGADARALGAALKELFARQKALHPKLEFRVDLNTLSGELVPLIDAAIGAGFVEATVVPLDPKK